MRVPRGRSTGWSAVKVNRAKQHIADLDALWKEFIADGHPHEVVTEEDPDGWLVSRVRIHRDPPPVWSAITGDAIHNLRSALDLMFGDLVRANNKAPINTDAFPISDSQTEFVNGARGKVKPRISEDALAVLESVQPYRGGNDLLWAIHKLDIIDKHRLLIVVGSASWGLVLETSVAEPGKPVKRGEAMLPLRDLPVTQKCPLKDGDVLFRRRPIGSATAPGVEFKFDQKIATTVAICEPGILKGEPVLHALHEFARTVTEVVDLFAPLRTHGAST